MKIQLLPSTFDQNGCASQEQRLTCFLIDDRVAVDAGSIALGLSEAQHESVRDVIVTHPHMDHMATLPIFIDDHFAQLTEPMRVHATEEVIALLERARDSHDAAVTRGEAAPIGAPKIVDRAE